MIGCGSKLMAHPTHFRRPEVIVVTTSEAVALLCDINKSRWLAPFMARPRSLKEVADKLGTTMGRYSYWLKKLIDYGLLNIAFEEKRRGTPIKYYWGAAERFEFTLRDSVVREVYGRAAEDYLTSILESLERTLRQDVPNVIASVSFDEQDDMVFGVRHQETGMSLWQEMIRPDRPALFTTCRDIQLSFSDAKALQKELYDVLEKYEARVNTKERHYLVQVGLARDE